ncbi:hypothetical protein Dimus_021655 [Dionaea muscipula]
MISFSASGGCISNSFKRGPAIAFRAGGDKFSLLFCGFVGYQDTIWDASGRHFFYSCYIEGATDFIFGDGRSVYQKAVINSSHPGYITAQAGEFPGDPGGFVFIGGYVLGMGPTYLGRAYRPYSRVVFRKTYFTDIIAPLGWNAWFNEGNEANFTYAEVGCIGPGANTSGRVHWLKNLSRAELKGYKVSTFIDQEGWISQQP